MTANKTKKLKLRQDLPRMIAVGTLVSGFQFYGPFKNARSAGLAFRRLQKYPCFPQNLKESCIGRQ